MVSNITLTSSMRSNLNSLKNIQGMMSRTQTVLSTGKKVNSAIDNATSYYQARSLTNRAADLNALLDSMGQGIQTVQAATTGLEKGLDFMEQASAIAMEAAEKAAAKGLYTTEINASMTTAEIQDILNSGGKIRLAEDITITETLTLSDNTALFGGGHTITYAGNGGFTTVNNSIVASDSALKVTGSDVRISNVNIAYTNAVEQGAAITIDGGSAEIDNIGITAATDAGNKRIYGIQVMHDGNLTLDNTDNISVAGKYSHKLVNGNPDVWDGKYNTAMIVEQQGADNIAAYACSQYYTVGTQAGDWYLPAEGELTDLYGTDYSQITNPAEGYGTTGAIGDNKNKVNDTLDFLSGKGAQAATLSLWYSSSTESSPRGFWILKTTYGERNTDIKSNAKYIRAFQEVRDIDASGAEVGDILYDDKTYSKADDEAYAAAMAAGKTAIGVVVSVDEDKTSLKAVALQDLATTGSGDDAVFDPDDPYYSSGKSRVMKWQKYCYSVNNPDGSKSYYDYVDITNNKDYIWEANPSLYSALTGKGTITVTNQDTPTADAEIEALQNQYNQLMGQYDTLIEDSSYQGINLLNNGTLNVTFNETRTSNYSISGIDASASGLGVNSAAWQSVEDIQASINQVLSAVNKMRGFQSELGTSYQIIQTRQNFTDGMIDILETGADDLVLADMNEGSAQYLMLQTRQQLAINSLSLASQSAQSVLKLF